MSWPKHNWGWIVLGQYGRPMYDNGNGRFIEASFNGYGEVFLDRKAAEWIAREEQSWVRKYSPESTATICVVRIALPGTYPQVQAPKRPKPTGYGVDLDMKGRYPKAK